MVKLIALHKLTKLKNSKMLLIFGIAATGLALFTLLPFLFIQRMAGTAVGGGPVAGSFFGMINFFGWIVSLTLGSTLWRQDEKDGTLFSFMAKPISRIEMLYGKLLGCIYALLIYLGFSVVLFGLLDLLFFHAAIPALAPLYLVGVFFEWMAYLSLALFLSCFFTSLVSSFLVVLGGFLSFLARQLLQFDANTAQLIGKILRFPFIDTNMEFSPVSLFVPELPIAKQLISTAGYFGLWAVCLLAASILIFRNKEFHGKRS